MPLPLPIAGLPLAKTANKAPQTKTEQDAPNVKKIQCIAKGGKWDEGTQSCIMPEINNSSTSSISPPKQNPSQPEFIKDEKGNVTGLVLPNGSAYLDLPPDQINAMLGKYNQIPSEITKQNIQQAGTEAAANKLIQEQQQLYETEQPLQRELSPEKTTEPLASLPVVGPLFQVADTLIGEAIGLKNGRDEGVGYDLNPEELRTAALTKIEEDVYKEGVKADTKFGGIVEGLRVTSVPFLGNFAKTLISTPSGEVSDIRANIADEVARANRYKADAKKGLIAPDVAIERMNEIEENLQRMESKIRLLINYSSELRANPSEVDKIESDLLKARTTLLSAKISAMAGAKGTTDDYSILEALKENE